MQKLKQTSAAYAEFLFAQDGLFGKVQQKVQIQWQKIGWSCVIANISNLKAIF